MILAFSEYFDLMGEQDRAKVLAYVSRHIQGPRNPTRKKAEAFLKRFQGG